MDRIIYILNTHQMVSFLMGIEPFNVESSGDVEEPTNYEKIWRLFIKPFLNEASKDQKSEFWRQFYEALTQLCLLDKDPGLEYYTIFSHLVEYYYLLYQEPHYQESIDLNTLSHKIAQGITRNKKIFATDYRWAGAKWNKSFNKGLGLLGVFIEISKQIQEMYKGPSFVPDELF
ncbi:hypothetical protein DYU11_09070 [Fibrisoma montanum]|uniref:Uncharacterized protein n=1 Tax=Fibrisoma montanum TaxID=2305895 RepID=A0A418MF50_9BACT|nr:hypothetical protein [Fibrisoma montanum]RIV25439.1 hypothetical protein DYU11_09070 [Fibrisoma montanum]